MSSPKPKHKDTQASAATAPAARAALLSQVDTALRSLADPVQAVPMRAYMLDQFAFLGIRAIPRREALRSLPRLLLLVQRQAWWDTVDGLAGVVGDILLRARTRQPDAQRQMDAWLGHPSLWVRRVAMLHQLGWKAQTDQARLFRYALALAPETDFFIRKAIGWALRDHAHSQPEAVRAFLMAHAHVLSGLTRREGGKHLG